MIRVLLRVDERSESDGGSSDLRRVVRVCSDQAIEVSQSPELIAVDSKETRRGKFSAMLSKVNHFDRVFADESQGEVYRASSVGALVRGLFQGTNFGVIAYGQTGTGKDYTLRGWDTKRERGLIPRAIEDLLVLAQKLRTGHKMFSITATIVRVQNETVYDILNPSCKGGLQAAPDGQNGTCVPRAVKMAVEHGRDIQTLMIRMEQARHKHPKSHILLTVDVSQVELDPRDTQGPPISPSQTHQPARMKEWVRIPLGKMQFAELCGSEVANPSSPFPPAKNLAQAKNRLRERQSAAKGLNSIETVVSFLKRGNTKHLPYRNSKISYLLKGSISEIAVAVFIVCISRAKRDLKQTRSSVSYAERLCDVFQPSQNALLADIPTRCAESRAATQIQKNVQTAVQSTGHPTLTTRAQTPREPKQRAFSFEALAETNSNQAQHLLEQPEPTPTPAPTSIAPQTMQRQKLAQYGNLDTKRGENDFQIPQKMLRLSNILNSLEYKKQNSQEWNAIKTSALHALDSEISKLYTRFNELAAALDASNGDLNRAQKTIREQKTALEGQKRVFEQNKSLLETLKEELGISIM